MAVARAETSFGAAIDAWRALIERSAETPDQVLSNLQVLYRDIFEVDFSRFDVAGVAGTAQMAIEEIFDLRLRVRDRLAEWQARGLLTSDSALAARNAIRALRYTGDIVGEVANGFQRLEGRAGTFKAFQGPPSWTLTHPARQVGERLYFRSGDVLMVRGRLHNSAAIARIGDIDSQFSHVGLVHIDAEGARWMVEALIEEGAVISPLEDALEHGLGRAVVLRHRDKQLAARASTIMFDRVMASHGVMGRWIPYDFSMEIEGGEALYCSKLVREAFRDASESRLLLPTHATLLNMTNRDFFERIGVTAHETFAPADLEVEPDFDVVAEWRDYRVTSSLRMQDLIMSRLFDWMDAHGYQFRTDFSIAAMAIAGRASSWLPDMVKTGLARLGVPKIPSNMTTRTIGVIAMLHKTAQPILEHLEALEQRHIAQTGRPMHPREVLAELDTYRARAPDRIGYLVAG